MDAVDGPVVREEGTDDLDLLAVFDVPEEDHLVAVDGDYAMAGVVGNDG